MENIGLKIKKRREEKNMSVQELAKKSNISRRYIYEIESGQANVTIKTFSKLLAALNLKMILYEQIIVTGEEDELLVCLEEDLIEKDGITFSIY